MSRNPQVLGQIDQILSSIEASHNKSAAARTEPGSIGGHTTHPSGNVDDHTSKATEGFRSKENESDVNRAVGAAGVNNASDAQAGSAADAQYNIGVVAKPTGEDPKSETSSAKGGKSDAGGTSSPARTDNDSLNGGKYAGVHEAIQVLRQRTKSAQAIGTELLSQLAVVATAPETKQAAPAVEQAEVGYNFADVASPDLDKQALDNIVIQSLAETVAVAEDQAVKTAEYLDTFFASLQKRAEEEGEVEDNDGDNEVESPEEAAAEAATGAENHGGGEHNIDPEQLQQLLHLLLAQQGGHEGGGDPSAMLQGGQGMGGASAVAGMGGPGDNVGDMPPGGEEGAEHMAMLNQAMIDAGTNPEEVEAMAAKQAAESLKAWRAKQAGKVPTWRPKNAAQAKAAQEMTAYLQELTGRSR